MASPEDTYLQMIDSLIDHFVLVEAPEFFFKILTF